MDQAPMFNPLSSIVEWCDGVGHRGREALYAALVFEEAGELAACVYSDDEHVSGYAQRAESLNNWFSLLLRERPGRLIPKGNALDAALDTAWVALCLAYQLVGCDPSRLSAAWSELHRSNVTDKQLDGIFVLDAGGKVIKPHTWVEPNFKQFLP